MSAAATASTIADLQTPRTSACIGPPSFAPRAHNRTPAHPFRGLAATRTIEVSLSHARGRSQARQIVQLRRAAQLHRIGLLGISTGAEAVVTEAASDSRVEIRTSAGVTS